MKLLLKISYVGTGYCGFQAQKSGRAIQNVFTEATERLFGFPCNVTGCSRTDSGVHAYGFCLTVSPKENRGEAWCSIPLGKIHSAYAPLLPSDIAVVGAAEVSDEFHPRYDSKGKEYIYKIWSKPEDDPFYHGRVHKYRGKLTCEAVNKMNSAAQYFVGEHDFAAFMASGSKIEDTVRRVFYAKVEKDGDGIVCFTIAANGFLYNMVRIMAGTLLSVASGKCEAEDIPKIIASENRAMAGATAPPEGLYLNRVFYENEINWECD